MSSSGGSGALEDRVGADDEALLRSGAPAAESAAVIDRLVTIYQRAPLGFGVVDVDGRTTMTNDALRALLGYGAEEFASMPFREFTHPEDVARNQDLFDRMMAGEIETFTLEKRFIRKDRGILWADLTVSLVRDAQNRPEYAIGMTQDATSRKRMETDLRAAEERHRLLVERVPAVVYITEPGPVGRWVYVSPQIERMLGFTAQEWMDDRSLWRRQLHPDDVRSAQVDGERIARAGADGEPISDTYRLRHRDGTVVWVRDDAIVLRDAQGQGFFHGVLVDVTEEKRLEERLAFQAFHDPLTGLPNRKLFQTRVTAALAAEGSTDRVAVLFIDLDDFKTVNDSFGHASGDEVIMAAARRLRSCARDADTTARLGGDEFAVLMEGATAVDASELADRILDVLHMAPVAFEGRTLAIGASIGIAVAGPDETSETLLRNADLAMYEAKRGGRGRRSVYDPSMHAVAVQRFRLEASVQAAITADVIAQVYQPIVDLRTGEVVGLEALARWTDAELGEVHPSEFIPAVETMGLVHVHGRRSIDRALRDLRSWRIATGGHAYVSVNVSPLQLDNSSFPATVQRMLRGHGLEPAALVLEVTEGLLLVDRSLETLRELRAGGIRVAIDDFGTGYSSLSYLRSLPVDMMKIDQSFLQATDTRAQSPAFVQAIVGLAETLDLDTICEGVETPAQLATLRATTCGYGQGFLLGRPGPYEDVSAFVDLLAAAPDGVAP